MRVVVSDVSVLFDLYELELLTEFFALPFDICTTDFVYAEIQHNDQQQVFEELVKAGRLIIIKTTAEEINTIQTDPSVSALLSFPDKTLLWHTLRSKGTLLSGDKKLRQHAESLRMEVHGVLWVIEMLVEQQQLGMSVARERLQQLKAINPRLSKQLIDSRIEKMKQ